MDLIGEMDAICRLMANNPNPLGAGNQDAYTVLLSTRGKLRKRSGNRASVTADIIIQNSWTLTVRKQNALVQALRPDLKWEIRGEWYTVQTWEDLKEDHRFYVFELTQDNA